MTTKNNNQKETVKIEQFLLQIGTPENKKMNGLRHVFNGETPEDEAALFKSALTYHKEKVEPYLAEYEEEQLFPYPEDQELHDSIHKLPLQERAVWILTYFHALPSTSISMIINESEDSVAIRQQAAREKLHTLLTNGENGLSESQLDKSMDFLLGAYEKLELPGVIEDEELPEFAEFTENVAEEPKPVSRFKWAGPASGTLIILLIGLAFMLPAFEPGSGSQNESAEEEQEEKQEEEPELTRIPEEEIKDLEEAIAENLSSLESKTGMTKRELRQINYIYQTSTVAEEARTINRLDEYEEHERDFVVNFSDHKEYLTYELKAPLEFVDEEIENIGAQDYGPDPFAFSDMLASTLIYRSKGFESMYGKKMTMLHRNHAEQNNTEGAPSSADIPQEIKSLQEKIRDNGFDYAYHSETESFDVFLGGPVFTEKLVHFDPIYQTYLKDMPELPYVINQKIRMPLDKVPAELFKIEEWLQEVTGGEDTAGIPWVFDELALEHERLLTVFIYGTEEQSNFEDGRLKEEVQTVWENLIQPEYLEKYESAAAIKKIYDELAGEDFKKPENWNRYNNVIDLSYSVHPNELYVQEPLIPLKGGELSLFEDYQRSQDSSILKELSSEEIALFYLQAIDSADPETVYSLLADTPERPSRDEFFETVTPKTLEAVNVSDILYPFSYFENDNRNSIFFETMNHQTWMFDLAEENDVKKIVFNKYDFY